MNSEHLKIAFMRGVLRADCEAGITLKDHMGMLKTAWPGWMALAAPALGAGLGAMATPGEELKGAMGGGMLGLGAYGTVRGVGTGVGTIGKALWRGVRGAPKVLSKAAPAAAAAAVPRAAAAAAPAAAAAAAPTAAKAMSPAWKAGLTGAGVGAGLGAGAYHMTRAPSVSPEEQQLLDQYRAQQMQQMQQMNQPGM